MRHLISSGSPYEPRVGISRAVRAGSIIAVSGTAPLGPDGKTNGKDDPTAQGRRCLEIIKEALERAGASLEQVIRTRTPLTQIADWQAVAAVRGEFSAQFARLIRSCRSYDSSIPTGSSSLTPTRLSTTKSDR